MAANGAEGAENAATAANPYSDDAYADADKARSVKRVFIPASIDRIDLAFFQLFPNAASIEVASESESYSSENGMLLNAAKDSLLLVPEGMEGNAVLPATVATVPACVFSRCTKLTAIVATESSAGSTGDPALASQDGILYTNDLKTLLAAPAGLGASARIAPECTRIAEGAFGGNTALRTIVAAEAIATIEDGAFLEECKQKATVVTSSRAAWEAAGFVNFADAAQAGDTIQPEEGQSGFAFDLMDDMTLAVRWQGDQPAPAHLIIPDYGTLNGVRYAVGRIADGAFANQPTVAVVDMPNTVTSIGNGAFEGCANLRTVHFSKATAALGEHSFAGTALLSAVLPASVTRIADGAFANLDGTTVVALGTVHDVAATAFVDSTNVDVYVPYNADDAYSFQAGLPASGNHLYPYGVRFATDQMQVEEGTQASLYEDGLLEAPGNVEVSYAYKAKSISINTEEGTIEAKQLGSSAVQVLLQLPVEEALVNGMLQQDVRLEKASFGGEGENDAANVQAITRTVTLDSGSTSVLAKEAAPVETEPETAVAAAAEPVAYADVRTSTADVGPFALPTTANANNADPNVAGWSITNGTVKIWSQTGVKVADLDFQPTADSGNKYWKRWLDSRRSDCITAVDTSGLSGAADMRWWFRDFGHGDESTKITDISKCVIPSASGMVPMSIQGLFYSATSLESAEGFTIPAGVQIVGELFSGCSSLKKLGDDFELPTSVVECFSLFRSCHSLEYLPPKFGSSWSTSPVRLGIYTNGDKQGMLSECVSLKELPGNFTLPNNVADANYAFAGCTSLTVLPASLNLKNVTISAGANTMFKDVSNLNTSYMGTDANNLLPKGATGTVANYWKSNYSRNLMAVGSAYRGALPTTANANNTDLATAGWALVEDVKTKEGKSGYTLRIWSKPGVKVKDLNFTITGTANANAHWKKYFGEDQAKPIVAIDTTGLSGAESMWWWFRSFKEDTSSETEIEDVSRLVIPSAPGMVPTNIAGLLYNANKLETVGDGFVVPEGVTIASELFNGCTSIKSIHEGFKLPKTVVQTMSMFRWCTSLEYLPAGFGSEWSDSPVSIGYYDAPADDGQGMFKGCYSLKELPAGFTLPKNVTDASYAFAECRSLKTLPASLDLKNVTISAGVDTMFGGVTNLDTKFMGTSLDNLLPKGASGTAANYWKTKYGRNLTAMNSAFMGALPTTTNPSNTDPAVAGWSVTDDAKAADGTAAYALHIWSKPGIKVKTLGFDDFSDKYWKKYLGSALSKSIAVIDTTGLSGAEDMYWWFRDFKNGGKTLIWDIDRCVIPSAPGMVPNSLQGLFFNATTLKKIPDSFVVPDGVNILSELFNGCSSIETLPAGFKFPTSATIFTSTFRDCAKLTSLPAGFGSMWSDQAVNTGGSNGSDHWGMFKGCTALTALPEGFTLPKNIYDGTYMFEGCTALKTLPASLNLATTSMSADTASKLFGGVTNLETTYNGTAITNLLPKGQTKTVWNYWKDTYGRILKPEAAQFIKVTFQFGSNKTEMQVKKGSTIDRSAVDNLYGVIDWYTNSSYTTAFDFTRAISATNTINSSNTLYASSAVTLKWDSQGGSAVANTTQNYAPGAVINAPATTPTRLGYTFDGWFTGANGSGSPISAVELPAKATTFFAKWIENSYKVHYRASATAADSAVETSFVKFSNGKVTLKSATTISQTGQNYTQWKNNVKSGMNAGAQVNVSQLINAANPGTKDATTSTNYHIYVWPDWKWNTYTITFKPNGGTGNMGNLAMTYNTAKNLTANAFTRKGWSFAGWNTKADGSGTNYTDKQSVNNLTTANKGTVELFAKWTAKTYTLEYTNNATGGTLSTTKQTFTLADVTGSKIKFPTMTVKRGYTAWGYKTASGATLTGTNANATFKKGATATEANFNTLFGADGNTLSAKLYAVYGTNTYVVNVTNQATGGTLGKASIASFTYANRTSQTFPTMSPNIGYEAWGFKTASGATLTGSDAAATFKKGATMTDANFNAIFGTADTDGTTAYTKTIYAVYSTKTYKVTYTMGTYGQSISPNEATQTGAITDFLNKKSVPAATAKSGYTFRGWSTAATSATATAYPVTAGTFDLARFKSVFGDTGQNTTVALNGQYTTNSYNLTGTLEGGTKGSVTNGSQTVAYGSKIKPVTFTTEDGYTITKITEGTTVLYDKAAGTALPSGKGSITRSGDKNVYTYPERTMPAGALAIKVVSTKRAYSAVGTVDGTQKTVQNDIAYGSNGNAMTLQSAVGHRITKITLTQTNSWGEGSTTTTVYTEGGTAPAGLTTEQGAGGSYQKYVYTPSAMKGNVSVAVTTAVNTHTLHYVTVKNGTEVADAKYKKDVANVPFGAKLEGNYARPTGWTMTGYALPDVWKNGESVWNFSTGTMPDADLTLSAVWQPKTTALTLAAPDADAEGQRVQHTIATYDSTLPAKASKDGVLTGTDLAAPVRKGFAFEGYYLVPGSATMGVSPFGTVTGVPAGSEKLYEPDGTTGKLKAVASAGAWSREDTALTLQAHWVRDAVTKVTFATNGGTGGTAAVWQWKGIGYFTKDPAAADFDKAADVLAADAVVIPTKADNRLDGYFTKNGVNSDWGFAVTTAAAGWKLPTAKSGSPAGAYDYFSTAATLYAKWTSTTSTIRFFTDDGSGAGMVEDANARLSGAEGDAVEVGFPELEKTGFWLDGWYTDEECTSKTGDTVPGDNGCFPVGTPGNPGTKSYYAKWVPYTIEVAYSAGEGAQNSGDATQTLTFGAGTKEGDATAADQALFGSDAFSKLGYSPATESFWKALDVPDAGDAAADVTFAAGEKLTYAAYTKLVEVATLETADEGPGVYKVTLEAQWILRISGSVPAALKFNVAVNELATKGNEAISVVSGQMTSSTMGDLYVASVQGDVYQELPTVWDQTTGQDVPDTTQPCTWKNLFPGVADFAELQSLLGGTGDTSLTLDPEGAVGTTVDLSGTPVAADASFKLDAVAHPEHERKLAVGYTLSAVDAVLDAMQDASGSGAFATLRYTLSTTPND